MIEGHQNIAGVLTPYITDGSNILINTDLIGDIKIEGYEDLLNAQLKGKIAAADPASSSSGFAQLTNMLLAMGGDYESDKGWDYVGSLIKNLDGKVANGSGAVHKGVADGEFVVGLTYEDPSASYIRDGAPVKIVYPKEGAVYLDAALAIIKDAKHKENAEKFIDFMCREDIALKNFEYITYSTPNEAAQALIEDQEIKNSPIAFPVLSDYENLETFEYLGTDSDELYNQLWKEVKSE